MKEALTSSVLSTFIPAVFLCFLSSYFPASSPTPFSLFFFLHLFSHFLFLPFILISLFLAFSSHLPSPTRILPFLLFSLRLLLPFSPFSFPFLSFFETRLLCPSQAGLVLTMWLWLVFSASITCTLPPKSCFSMSC